jgi:hypothetical protein
MSQELESTSPADTLPMLERAGIARTPVTLESTSPADTLQMLEGADIAGALVELKGTSPAECLGEVMAKSDNCGSVTARILAKRDALVRRHRPDPLAPGPVRTADLKDPFEWELFAVLKKGGLELVRCLADQARKTGDVLIPIELSEPAASLVKDLWLHTGCNPLLGLGIDGLDGTPDRL